MAGRKLYRTTMPLINHAAEQRAAISSQMLAIVGAALVAACGGGGGAGAGSGVSNSNPDNASVAQDVQITVRAGIEAVEGITVVLHDTDGVAIAAQGTTDGAGRVLFESVRQESLTLTAGLQAGNDRRLITVSDVPRGNYTVELPHIPRDITGSISANFSVSFEGLNVSQVPNEANLAFPHDSSDSNLFDGSADFENFLMFDRQVGLTNQVALLAIATRGGEPTLYGFIAGEEYVDGGSYAGALDQPIDSVTFDIPGATAGLVRAFFDGISIEIVLDGEVSDGRTLPVAGQLAADYYRVRASEIVEQDGVGLTRQILRREAALPETYSESFGPQDLSNVGYAAATQTINWTSSGDNADFFIARAFVPPQVINGINTVWDIYVPTDTRSVVLPTLPSEYEAWVDRTEAGDFGVTITDMLATESYTQAIVLATDQVPNSDFSQDRLFSPATEN